MSWTNTNVSIKLSISLHDRAPDDVLVPVDAVVREVTDHLRERIEALGLPRDQVQVEVW